VNLPTALLTGWWRCRFAAELGMVLEVTLFSQERWPRLDRSALARER